MRPQPYFELSETKFPARWCPFPELGPELHHCKCLKKNRKYAAKGIMRHKTKKY